MLARMMGVLIVLLAAGKADASSLFLDDAASAVLSLGDVLDQVVVSDTAHITINGGVINDDLTLLDTSTATLFSGFIGGFLEVYDDAQATLVRSAPAWIVNLAIKPDNTILSQLDCPTCNIVGAGTLNAKAGQAGQIVLVPEPMSALLLGLGLMGLALPVRRHA